MRLTETSSLHKLKDILRYPLQQKAKLSGTCGGMVVSIY